jgi:hypothetical protein
MRRYDWVIKRVAFELGFEGGIRVHQVDKMVHKSRSYFFVIRTHALLPSYWVVRMTLRVLVSYSESGFLGKPL